MKKTIFNSKKESDTNDFANEVAKSIDGYNVICLYGDLGAGKTTFVKSFARALGIETRIISPTYVLIRTHKTLTNKTLFHIDAYRLIDEKDAYEIKEILGKDNAIIVIEWADKIKSILPERRVDIVFTYKNKNEREIKLEQYS